MNRWQKIAWYNIIVILVTFSLTGTNVGVLTIKYGFPKALSGLGTLGFLGLLGLSGVIFRKKKSHVDFDERDKLIFYRVIQITFALFWPLLTAVCMIPWLIVGLNNTISSNALPIILLITCIPLILLQSLTTLILYGRGGKDVAE